MGTKLRKWTDIPPFSLFGSKNCEVINERQRIHSVNLIFSRNKLTGISDYITCPDVHLGPKSAHSQMLAEIIKQQFFLQVLHMLLCMFSLSMQVFMSGEAFRELLQFFASRSR